MTTIAEDGSWGPASAGKGAAGTSAAGHLGRPSRLSALPLDESLTRSNLTKVPAADGSLTGLIRASRTQLLRRVSVAEVPRHRQSCPHSLAWRWTRFRPGRRRVSPWWRRRRRILRWRVSGIASGRRRRGGRPIPGRRWRVISRWHTSAAIWTKTIAWRARARSIWDAVAIGVTMKAGPAASRHKKNIRFRKWSWQPCSRGTLRTVGRHQA
jgi:hypothetical protein